MKLPHLIGIGLLLLLLLIAGRNGPEPAKSAGGQVVISEIQVAGVDDVSDEFVELYNPSAVPVDMTGWRLTRRSSSGGSAQNLVANLAAVIPAHGFFLIAHPNYTGTSLPDKVYSASSSAMTGNNIVTLYSDAGTTVVDLVGMGTATISETSPADSPAAGESIERKALATSTSATMVPGGADAAKGNGHDTDHNQNDFVVRTNPQPQNSHAVAESPSVVWPSPTPGPIPTNTPGVTPVPTKTPTPQPTSIPGASPTPTVAPQPTATPKPTKAPLPTVTPTHEPLPTSTPVPTIKPPASNVVFRITCRVRYLKYRIFNRFIFFPHIICR
jgi:hypothetical protein